MKQCYRNEDHGLYLWTVGQRQNIRDAHSKFVWKHSNDALKFTHWHAGEPNNVDGTENCVNMWPDQGYQWNDQPCDVGMCFVCEQ